MKSEEQVRNEKKSLKILQAMAYGCVRCDFGGFEIVGLSSTDCVLVKVCEKIPWAGELDSLQKVTCPPNCRKMIHAWHSRRRLPDVVEI